MDSLFSYQAAGNGSWRHVTIGFSTLSNVLWDKQHCHWCHYYKTRISACYLFYTDNKPRVVFIIMSGLCYLPKISRYASNVPLSELISLCMVWIFWVHFDPSGLISWHVVFLRLQLAVAWLSHFPSPFRWYGEFPLLRPNTFDWCQRTKKKNMRLKVPFPCVLKSPAAQHCLFFRAQCSCTAKH